MTRYFPEVVEAVQGQLPGARGDRRGDRRAGPRAQLPGVRGAPAAHPPRREPGEPAGRSRRPRASSRSTCSPSATRTSPSGRSASAGPAWRRRWPRPGRRCTSRRSPTTTPSPSEWFDQFEGAGLDGLIAKDPEGTYQPDKRVMTKIKHERTADCVVAGYRVHKSGPDAIGSLLLGLYQDDGHLASVGVIGAFPMPTRRALVHGDAAAGHDVRRPPVGVGAAGGGRPHPAQGRGQPLERQQGPLVHPAAARAGGRGALRLHGGRALPAHRPVRAVAARPRAVLVHVRAAGAAGARSTWPRCWACPDQVPRGELAAGGGDLPAAGVAHGAGDPGRLARGARTRPGACAARRPTRCPAWG